MTIFSRLCRPLVYLSRSQFEIICSSVQQSIEPSKKICKRDISVQSILASASSSETAANTVVWGSKKSHRKIKLNFPVMTNPQDEVILEPLRLAVKEQVNGIQSK